MQPLRTNTIPTNTPHKPEAQEPIQPHPFGGTRALPVALELLRSGAPVQEQPSESGREAIQSIRHLLPEQREEENLTSSIARLVLGPNSEPPQPTSGEQESSPYGRFGVMPQPLLLGFIESSPPQSLALLAQTNHTMRDVVRDYRIQQTARIKNEPGLEDLLTSFCPQSLSAKNFNSITNTLFTIVVPNVLASLKSSPYVSDEEKGELLAHSPEAIVNSPSLLKTVLQAAYDESLVFLVAVIRSQNPPPVLQATSRLREKALASRNWLTSNVASVTEIRYSPSPENDYRVTCLPMEICALRNLAKLSLSNNRLTVLPHKIGGLQNLVYFYISDNQLTALPSEIGGLQNLATFSFSCGHLTALPSEIGRLQKLEELSLDGNQLTGLPPEFGGLQKLSMLVLDESLRSSVPESLKSKTGLKIIYTRLK